jgi:hypothetical protein
MLLPLLLVHLDPHFMLPLPFYYLPFFALHQSWAGNGSNAGFDSDAIQG